MKGRSVSEQLLESSAVWGMVLLILMLAMLAGAGCGGRRRGGTASCSVPAEKETVDAGNIAVERRSGVSEAEAGGKETDLDEIFSLERKFEELKAYYAEGRYGFVVGQAEAMLGVLGDVGAREDCEKCMRLHFILARAYARLGEDEQAIEHMRRFKEYLARTKSEVKRGGERKAAEAIRGMIERSLELEQNESSSEEDLPINVRCHRRLESVQAPEEVLCMELDDGGRIYFSSSPEALERHVTEIAAVAGPVISRDPRYGFYYCIVENDDSREEFDAGEDY